MTSWAKNKCGDTTARQQTPPPPVAAATIQPADDSNREQVARSPLDINTQHQEPSLTSRAHPTSQCALSGARSGGSPSPSTESRLSTRREAHVESSSQKPSTTDTQPNQHPQNHLDDLQNQSEHRDAQKMNLPDPRHQLSDYRQRLAREISARVNSHTSPVASPFAKRPSPIEEENLLASDSHSAPSASTTRPTNSASISHTTSSPAPPSALPSTSSSGTTASTDSTRTERAIDIGKGNAARTPSYPFPRMIHPSSIKYPLASPAAVWTAHPGAKLDSEPGLAMSHSRTGLQRHESTSSFRSDNILSSPSTPASTVRFLPSDLADRAPTGEFSSYANHGHRPSNIHHHDLETPNLYELALALSSEPGLDSWWNTVVQVATQWYKAERVALAIPSDSADVENMPWGQKATYKPLEKDDDLSLGYMGHDSNLGRDTTDIGSDMAPLPLASGFRSPPPPPSTSPFPLQQLRRPSLTARYSYTTYEDQKENHELEEPKFADDAEQNAAAPSRPSLSRCQTSQPISTLRSAIPKADLPSVMLPPKPYAPLNHAALEEHDAIEGPQIAPVADSSSFNQRHDTRARVLPVLQALDYEADPLIDHNGVQLVLERGRVVALTRSYPYISSDRAQPGPSAKVVSPLAPPPSTKAQPASLFERLDEETRSDTNLSRLARDPAHEPSQHPQREPSFKTPAPPESHGPPSSRTAHVRASAYYMRRLTSASIASKLEEAKPHRSISPLYEEYEQMPPSPWSQSPAPSPAVRHDPAENPFFSDAVVDEDSFNPTLSPEEYKELSPPEAIGLDNAWTVLHVPLYHPLLSKTHQPFRLDMAKKERRSSPIRDTDEGMRTSTNPSPSRPKKMPIAILSILSPIIPYPSNLRHSLEHLAPHMATSFTLCAHHSSLEAEVSGLNRRRQEVGGFGGVDTNGNPLLAGPAVSNTSFLGPEEPIAHRSHAGSMTSFSDYSTRSRSIAGSPGGTPGWDPATLNVFHGNTGNGISPSIASLTSDGYFGVRNSNIAGLTRPVTTPGGASSNGGGGGSSAQRGRKNSLSHSEKRLSSLRPLEGSVSAQEERTMCPVADSAGARTSSPSLLFSEESLEFPQQSTQGMSGTAPGEPGTGGLTEALSSSHSSRSSHLMPAVLSGTSNPPSADSKRRAAEREAAVSDELKFVSADRTPLFSPMLPTPGGTYQHRHARFLHHSGQNHGGHSQLHSYGADFASTFPSLPPSGTVAVKGAGATMLPPTSVPSRAGSVASSSPVDMPPPSDRLKGLILDSLPAHVFVAMPQTGAIVWVNSRYLAYRGQTVEGLAEDPWGSLHPDDREEYLKSWSHSIRTGDQFSRTVRIRRFDGSYRWFQARAVASRDRRNSIMQFLGSYMDIHDQHIAELKAARQEEIEASETKHRILANLIPQIIFTANEEEGVTFANEQWLSYTGQSFDDLLGLGFLDNVHPDDLAKCSFLPVPVHLQERRKRLLQAATSPLSARGASSVGERSRPTETSDEIDDEELSELAELARRGIIMVTTDDNGRPSYTTEVRLRSKTGEYRWHLVRCVETGTMDFGKGYNSYFGSATDINDHKLLETKLKEAMDSKTRFLSNMSHEIRTPLIGISGMVSFLQDTVLDEEQRDYTNTIQTSANSLLMIINDILDLSKVDAGMMKLSLEWFHTRSLIEDVNELVSTMAVAKRLELNYIVDNDVPSFVKGDRVRMRQVLLNVIGNAVKFTNKGEVFSRCRVVQNKKLTAGEQIELEFSVTDTGRGFTKEEADLIFKPFSQIDGSSTRQHGGSGLGLVISRQLVELHGGKMHGSAVPGQGSTFTFTAIFKLPTELDHPDLPSEASLAVPNRTLTSMGIATPSFMDPAAIMAAAAASAAGAGPTGIASVSAGQGMDAPLLPLPAGEFNQTSGPSTRPKTLQSPSVSRSGSTLGVDAAGLSHFGEAASASSQNLPFIKFEMPSRNLDRPTAPSPTQSTPDSCDTTTTTSADSLSTAATVATAPKSSQIINSGPKEVKGTAVPTARKSDAYSILIICPQMHSREATVQHIESTIPKDRPHQIQSTASAAEAQEVISAKNAKPFTHVVVNLPSPQEILELVGQLDRSTMLETATVLVLSDSVQRQAVNRLAAGTRYEQLLSEARIIYIYKPVKPSRFAVIFDPQHESDISIDRNRFNAQRLVETQKQSYQSLAQRMGNKGYKVLLVEDNMVNQKVLTKYLQKVGVEVDMAADGVECTEIVLSRPHDYYSLILCDLHMPRKDGYQACREIREWEAKGKHAKRLPIIALSANVMSDVHDKCVIAGFSKYITKPVDFIVLSRALAEFF
ncbi:hypothetical protein SEPCBS119000_002525 [Sporothrix epigloea]|uniref:Uncharacterized protein n=1 Tax=Sporothrix epigloea TaxID=1892477 RepID=A0ABP0DGM4_9PEZI